MATTKTEPAPKKIKPPTPAQYRNAKIQEALRFAPPIYPCADCGWPVVKGYCCNTCGSADPEGH